MNRIKITFSPKAKQRLEDITDYLYQQNLSSEFVINYIDKFESWLENVLGLFPESGTPMPEYGENIRRVVYQEYSFIYRIKEGDIEILTIYRENLP